jgi:hypothetical protein
MAYIETNSFELELSKTDLFQTLIKSKYNHIKIYVGEDDNIRNKICYTQQLIKNGVSSGHNTLYLSIAGPDNTEIIFVMDNICINMWLLRTSAPINTYVTNLIEVNNSIIINGFVFDPPEGYPSLIRTGSTIYSRYSFTDAEIVKMISIISFIDNIGQNKKIIPFFKKLWLFYIATMDKIPLELVMEIIRIRINLFSLHKYLKYCAQDPQWIKSKMIFLWDDNV